MLFLNRKSESFFTSAVAKKSHDPRYTASATKKKMSQQNAVQVSSRSVADGLSLLVSIE